MKTRPPLEDAFIKLLTFLALERQHVLDGQIFDIAEITKAKASCLDQINKLLNDPSSAKALSRLTDYISRIKRQASENETLLLAAKNGVSSAKQRLKGISEAEKLVGIYTREGEKLLDYDSIKSRHKFA